MSYTLDTVVIKETNELLTKALTNNKRLSWKTNIFLYTIFFQLVKIRRLIFWCIFFFRAKYFCPEKQKIRTMQKQSYENGLTALVRVGNEEQLIQLVICNLVHEVDEILCVVNNSWDNSKKYLEHLKHLYGDKIRIYQYGYPVAEIGGKEERIMPHYSPYSYINVSNYALSKVRTRWVIKLDSDDFYLAKKIQSWKRNPHACYFYGINIIDETDTPKILKEIPICGGLDHFILDMKKFPFFLKGKNCESLVCRDLLMTTESIWYLHLKALKSKAGFESRSRSNKKWAEFQRIFEQNVSVDFNSIHSLPMSMDSTDEMLSSWRNREKVI